MNKEFSCVLDELEIFAPIKKLVNSPEWIAHSKKIDLAGDNDLIDTIGKVLDSLRNANYLTAKAFALMGVLYLTLRISKACEQLTTLHTHEPLEHDLRIALQLPGETAHNTAFKPADIRNSDDEILAELSQLLITLSTTKPKSCMPFKTDITALQYLQLRELSTIYSHLMKVLLAFPC